MTVSNPRCDELETMLDGLDPRAELVYRLALMSISPHCRGDQHFELQTMALQALLRLDEDGLADVRRDARALEQRLTATLAG